MNAPVETEAESAVEAVVLDRAINAAVIHLSTRHFPGVLIQGDTLSNIATFLRGAADNLARGNTAEAADDIDEARRSVDRFLSHYEAVLARHGFDLPYTARR